MRSETILELFSREKPQYRVMAALSAGAVGLAGVLQYVNAPIFQKFIGSLNPLAAAIFLAVLVWILFALLLSRGWFLVYSQENWQGLRRACTLAALFGGIVIAADLKIVFPADINVPLPEALLFYPAIGFFVEILFHVLPLTILMTALVFLFPNADPKAIALASILPVALLEPIYQTLWMVSTGHYPVWATGFVALHVLAINLLQLWIFKRYDFVSMYVFRLVYYLIWHIGWGYIRLNILF